MELNRTATLATGIEGLALDREYVLKNCQTKVVNGVMNYVLDGPHRWHCDLAELVVFRVDINGEPAMAVVNNELMKSAGIEEDVLFETARRNTAGKFVFLDYAAVMGVFPETEPTMYVVTNEDCIYGAAAITFPEYLKDVRERLGEDFWILPSSIHEILIVRKSLGNSSWELREMVQGVNRNVVVFNERLSDNVYEIDENGILKIAK